MSKPRFQQIYVEITNVCNLDCPFCIDTNRKKEFMSVDKFQIVVNKIKEYTHSIYLHVKGEPLIHPQFEGIINTLVNNNINTKITTNGTKLAEYGDLIINKPNINKINISLESIIHKDDLTIEKYFNNLKLFLKKVKTTHIYLRSWALASTEKEKINYYLKEIYGEKNFTDDELLDDHIHYSHQEKFTWPSVLNKEEEASTCLGGKNQLGILVDGSVVLCCLDNNGDTCLGNIFSDNLEDILNSEKYLNAVKKMPYFEICKKCSYRWRFKKKGGAV